MEIKEEKMDINVRNRESNVWNVEGIKSDLMPYIEKAKKAGNKSILFSAREFWKEYNETDKEYTGDRNQLYHGIRKILEKTLGLATSTEKRDGEVYIRVSTVTKCKTFCKDKKENKE